MRIALFCLIAAVLLPANAATEFDFPDATYVSKPWTRWWWMGNAVDDKNLTRSLEAFQAAGLGGVEITPIYGVKGSESRQLDYLSREWVDRLSHTTKEAARLGLGVDMPTGSGWPFGGPSVDLEDSDIKVSIVKVALNAPGDALGLPDGAVLLSLMAYGKDAPAIDITATVKDGILAEPLPPGEHSYYAVYYAFSGRMVKRPAPGGAGRTVNTYSATSLNNYLDHFSASMTGYSGEPLRAYFHDSFEYSGDWTPRFWDAFVKKHGYDLRQHLPELTGEGDPDHIARIKSDYRETLAALLLNDFTRTWTAWAHAQGALTRNQAHGSPGNLIDLYAAVDIPETEIFGPSGFKIPGLRNDPSFENEPPDLLMLKFASSAAHLTGKRLISSETCTWLGEHFQVSLAQCKPEIDQLLAAGINHILYHGTPYSPKEAAWPGWLFYASVHFAPTNTWWQDFAQLNAYVARCQALLQQSETANDVLLYFPLHDIWHDAEGLRKLLTVHNIDEWLIGSPFYEAAAKLRDAGYAFDYISDALLDTAEVREGRIVLGGNPYKVIVIPETPRMPLTTMRRLIDLAAEGANLIFQGPIPRDVPGFASLEARRAEMESIIASWEHATISNTQAGKVLENQSLDDALPQLKVLPESLARSGLSMIRRRHPEGYLYFLANLTEAPLDGYWPLATPASSVVLLDPLSDTAGLAATEIQNGQTQVRVALLPGQSCFLRTFTERKPVGKVWSYAETAGSPVSLDGPWTVTFLDGGPVVPEAYTANTLSSWTNAPDPEARRFAGTARYETHFDAPESPATTWQLDLGRVAESARVTLNGVEQGTVWSLPSILTLIAPLKKHDNVLTLDVTNLAANRIADMDRRQVAWKIFEDINIVDIKYGS